ncbi:MAG: ABC transporter substrate-binding protein [Chloroflexi bacterium]|nr:ABC transporter substrate-binding protein [Chloroflexota bacterium]
MGDPGGRDDRPAFAPPAPFGRIRRAAPPTRRGLLWYACALVLIGALAGCVTPAPSPARPTSAVSSPDATFSPPTPTALPLTKIVMAQSSQGFLYLPISVALDRGYFLDEGLSVQVWNYAGGDRARDAVVQQEAQVSDTAMIQVLAGREDGRSLTAFAAVQTEFALNLVMSNRVLQATGVTERSAPRQKVEALRGLRIGVDAPGSSSDQLPRYLLRLFGMAPEEAAAYVPLGNVDGVLTALATGTIDAAFLPSPYGEVAVRRGDGRITLELTRGEIPELQGYLHSVLYARQEFLEAHPDVATGLTRAVIRAQRWIRSNPAGLLASAKKAFPEADEVELRWAIEYNRGSYPGDARITGDGLALTVDWHNRGRPAPARFDLAAVATNRYVDRALEGLPAGARP